ncbi:MAG TPA: DUF481 domain-containing protein [Ignavibacteriaceae bacterium]
MKTYFIFYLILFVILGCSNFAQINTERYRKDSDSPGFTANANVDITAITGNTDFQFINIGGRLNYNWGESYTFLVSDAGFGWDEGKRIFDQALLHLRHVQSFSDLLQGEAFGQIDFNKKRLLNERELIGGGVRIRLLKFEDLKLRLGTGYFYEHEKINNSKNSADRIDLFANRLSTYLTIEYKLKDDINFNTITYFQPQIGVWGDYRILSENSLIISLSSLVDINIIFSLRYDSEPPETIKKLDTVTKFGFTFNF